MVSSKLRDFGDNIGGVALIAAALISPYLRSWRNRWGVTPDELTQTWSGDELIPEPKWQWTHAITIKAFTTEVWPWLAQIGQGRGGLYSYELLENLIGCNIHNADRIISEFQQLKTGDVIRLHPKMPGLPVVICEPNRAIVLHVKTSSLKARADKFADAAPQKYINISWAFILKPQNDGNARLISRYRNAHSSDFGTKLGYGPWFVEPIGFVMDRKMLLGIKQRVEAAIKYAA